VNGVVSINLTFSMLRTRYLDKMHDPFVLCIFGA
jgi:hypothetical protein